MNLFKKRNILYPAIEPFDTGTIKDGIHEIYYEQCGNPKGKPAVFLHGGPGEERVNFLEDFLIQKSTELSYLIKGDVATVNHMRVWKITPLGI